MGIVFYTEKLMNTILIKTVGYQTLFRSSAIATTYSDVSGEKVWNHGVLICYDTWLILCFADYR